MDTHTTQCVKVSFLAKNTISWKTWKLVSFNKIDYFLAVKIEKIWIFAPKKLSFHDFITAILGQNRDFWPQKMEYLIHFRHLKFKNIFEFWRKNSNQMICKISSKFNFWTKIGLLTQCAHSPKIDKKKCVRLFVVVKEALPERP